MDEHYDVFVSYASEDYAKALEQSRQLGELAVFLDEIENRPASTALGVVKANLRRVCGRLFLGEKPEQLAKTDDEIRGWLRSKMDRSKSILVIWSYSHRGSYWANEEISYFEGKYPGRRVFYVKVDPIEAPEGWAFLDDARELTREQLNATPQPLGGEPKQGEQLESTKPGVPELLLHPGRWIRRAAERHAGTSFSELVRLRVRHGEDARCLDLTRSVRNAILLALAVTGLLLISASVFLLSGGRDKSFARNAVLAVTSLWICLGLTGIQTSAAATVPALATGSLIGLVVEVITATTTKDTHGGGAAGAATGAFMGVAAAYQWHLSTSRPGRRALGSTEWGWVAKTVALATGVVVALASVIAGLLVPTHGNLRGGLTLVIVALLALVPFVAIWVEVSYWGRLKEFLRHGSAPAATLLCTFLIVGAGIWVGNPSVKQSTWPGGLVGGPVAGLCVSIMYMLPAAILGTRMPPHVRVLGAVSAVMVALTSLAFLLPVILPDANINEEVWLIVSSFAAALLGGGLLANRWLQLLDGGPPA